MTDAPYTFLLKIEAARPHEMPLKKLLEYVQAAEKLFGVGAAIHLVDIVDASTGAALLVDPNKVNQVEENITLATAGEASKTVMAGYRKLKALAENDNAPVRLIAADGAELVRFQGGSEEQLIGPVRQEGYLQGHIMGILGTDDSKHIRLHDGTGILSGIQAKEAIAAELGHHLFIPTVRLEGTGWWTKRPSVGWSLDRFKVTGFEVLDDRPISQVVAELQKVGAGSDWSNMENPWTALERMRLDS